MKTAIRLALAAALAWLDRWLTRKASSQAPSDRSRTGPFSRPQEPTEHLPPEHPDAAPPERRRKYPADTRPGRWNRDTGSFNP